MWDMSPSLSAAGKVVLITGCSEGGIGYYLALEFLRRGATVYATSRNVATMRGLQEQGIHLLALDVTSQESISAAVATIQSQQNCVDVLVNNAGVSMAGPFAETPIGTWRSFYETNVFGMVALSQAVFPLMAKQGWGRIVNISSVAAYAHRPWSSVYSSSKAAVNALTDCMRMEMKPFGVGVILVTPGYIRTKIFGKAASNSVDLPPGSLYAPYERTYKKHYINKVNDKRDTPADKFAVWVVNGALKVRPPWRMALGYASWLALCVLYLPAWLADAILWWKFAESGKEKLH